MDDEFDTFDNFNEEETTFSCESKNVIIRIDKRNARKSISYVEEWNLDLSELKEHLKNLKNKLGCNGSVKKKMIDGKSVIVFQLQGDKRKELKSYLIECGINSEKITIIG